MAEPPVELKPNIDESGIAQITVLAEGKKIVLGCERGGEYKEMKTKLKKEDTTTRKCQCPFSVHNFEV
jgi:hypothetical protein